MGDLELLKNQHEVDCALTVLGYCYKFDSLKVMFLFGTPCIQTICLMGPPVYKFKVKTKYIYHINRRPGWKTRKREGLETPIHYWSLRPSLQLMISFDLILLGPQLYTKLSVFWDLLYTKIHVYWDTGIQNYQFIGTSYIKKYMFIGTPVHKTIRLLGHPV